jgi:RNA-binding protein
MIPFAIPLPRIETERMPLSPTQRRYLRSLAHDLGPVIQLGAKGATEAVVKELGLALDHHELVKVKLSGGDRDERQQQIDTLIHGTAAEVIQQIGHVAVLFLRNTKDPKLALPR